MCEAALIADARGVGYKAEVRRLTDGLVDKNNEMSDAVTFDDGVYSKPNGEGWPSEVVASTRNRDGITDEISVMLEVRVVKVCCGGGIDVALPTSIALSNELNCNIITVEKDDISGNMYLIEGKEEDMDTMMTRKEVAEYLHVTVDTVGNMMRRGEIPYSKVSRRVLINERDVAKLIDKNRSNGA